MKETTLVHIVRDGCVLMMHRISKKDDINHGKWIGVGGKFEKGETPEACMRREVWEETGLAVDQYRYCGIVTFVSDENETEYMHLFTVTGFHDADGNAGIRLRECDEGTLEWLPKDMLTQIPHWAGDRIFLPLILDAEIPFFSMKLVYRKGELIHASLNEHNCLVTDRLVLRPWMEEDASALYRWARSPEIGPRAGWPPHRDVAESRNSIRAVLKRPEIYAIVLRDTAEPIGSVGLQNFRLADADGSMLTFFDERKSEDPLVCSRPGRIWEDADETDSICSRSEAVQSAGSRSEAMQSVGSRSKAVQSVGSRSETVQSAGMIGDMGSACMDNTGGLGLPSGVCVEAALGYWLAEPYQGKGIMHEAAEALLLHAKRDLGLRRVWADYYEGNDNSRKVMERLGLHYHHIEKDRYVEAMKERRTAIVYVTDLTHI